MSRRPSAPCEVIRHHRHGGAEGEAPLSPRLRPPQSPLIHERLLRGKQMEPAGRARCRAVARRVSGEWTELAEAGAVPGERRCCRSSSTRAFCAASGWSRTGRARCQAVARRVSGEWTESDKAGAVPCGWRRWRSSLPQSAAYSPHPITGESRHARRAPSSSGVVAPAPARPGRWRSEGCRTLQQQHSAAWAQPWMAAWPDTQAVAYALDRASWTAAAWSAGLRAARTTVARTAAAAGARLDGGEEDGGRGRERSPRVLLPQPILWLVLSCRSFSVCTSPASMSWWWRRPGHELVHGPSPPPFCVLLGASQSVRMYSQSLHHPQVILLR